MTALFGPATSFVQLAVARAGVSIGEGGGSPAAHSLIADYFPDRRAGALAAYAAGGPIGTILAAVGGGFLAVLFGWRWAFIE